MSFTVEQRGKDIEQLLQQLPVTMRDKIAKKAVREAGKVVAVEMRRRAPVDTGALRRSIKQVVRDYGEKTLAVIGPVTPDKKSSIKVNVLEFGSPKQRPQPFIRPAGDETARQQDQAIDAELKKGIEAEL